MVTLSPAAFRLSLQLSLPDFNRINVMCDDPKAVILMLACDEVVSVIPLQSRASQNTLAEPPHIVQSTDEFGVIIKNPVVTIRSSIIADRIVTSNRCSSR